MSGYKRKAIAEVKRLRKLMKRRRADLGFTLRQLARMSGVHASTINRFENGKEIETTSFVALLAALYQK